MERGEHRAGSRALFLLADGDATAGAQNRSRDFLHDRTRARQSLSMNLIIFGQKRVNWDWYHPSFDRLKKGGGPIDRIEQANENSFLAADSEGSQYVSKTIHSLCKLAVRQVSTIVDVSNSARTPRSRNFCRAPRLRNYTRVRCRLDLIRCGY
jgi:hypothetical protein